MSSYTDCYYARSLVDETAYLPLCGDIETDVCVIGGGLAGLATALGLIERGKRVVLLEARRIGWGASGRNGGFCLSGFAASPADLVRKVGADHARALFGLTKKAQALIRNRIRTYDIDCDPVDGQVVASWYNDPDGMKRKFDFLCDVVGETAVLWDRAQTRDSYVTNRYYDSIFFPENFHMDPLRYARGVAKAVVQKGGMVFEDSAVIDVESKNDVKMVRTEKGRIKADHVVYCGSAYFVNEPEKRLRRACLPVATYVMVTEPIAPQMFESAIRVPYAIRDTRYADDYYRPLPDGRLLWGGRISIGKDPADLAEIMRLDMVKIYPQLSGIKADVAWSGLMGYTVHRMPLVGCLEPGIWYCTNFGGNGVGPTTAGGEVIAKAIAGNDETYKLFEPFGFRFTGGLLGPLLAQAVYRSWEFADWLAELKTIKKTA